MFIQRKTKNNKTNADPTEVKYKQVEEGQRHTQTQTQKIVKMEEKLNQKRNYCVYGNTQRVTES